MYMNKRGCNPLAVSWRLFWANDELVTGQPEVVSFFVNQSLDIWSRCMAEKPNARSYPFSPLHARRGKTLGGEE